MELKKAIDQISKDKGIDRDMLIQTLEDAVRTSDARAIVITGSGTRAFCAGESLVRARSASAATMAARAAGG